MKKLLFGILYLCLVSCVKVTPEPRKSVDLVLIGGGIMSATLGSLLHELDPELTIEIFERLPSLAEESSGAWNNAGTGHAAYCELNYTSENSEGRVDISKAIAINESFELSKQFWAYHIEQKKNPLSTKLHPSHPTHQFRMG